MQAAPEGSRPHRRTKAPCRPRESPFPKVVRQRGRARPPGGPHHPNTTPRDASVRCFASKGKCPGSPQESRSVLARPLLPGAHTCLCELSTGSTPSGSLHSQTLPGMGSQRLSGDLVPRTAHPLWGQVTGSGLSVSFTKTHRRRLLAGQPPRGPAARGPTSLTQTSPLWATAPLLIKPSWRQDAACGIFRTSPCVGTRAGSKHLQIFPFTHAGFLSKMPPPFYRRLVVKRGSSDVWPPARPVRL